MLDGAYGRAWYGCSAELAGLPGLSKRSASAGTSVGLTAASLCVVCLAGSWSIAERAAADGMMLLLVEKFI